MSRRVRGYPPDMTDQDQTDDQKKLIELMRELPIAMFTTTAVRGARMRRATDAATSAPCRSC